MAGETSIIRAASLIKANAFSSFSGASSASFPSDESYLFCARAGFVTRVRTLLSTGRIARCARGWARRNGAPQVLCGHGNECREAAGSSE